MWVLYLKTVITCNSTSHIPFCTTTKVSRKSVTIYMSSWKFWVVFTFKFGHKWTFYINVGSLKEYCNLKKNVLVKPCIVSQLVNVQMAEFSDLTCPLDNTHTNFQKLSLLQTCKYIISSHTATFLPQAHILFNA